MKKHVAWMALLLVALTASLGACGSEAEAPQYKQVVENAKKQRAYVPKRNVELRNYNDAQKLYDSPDTIIWCSTTWGNANSPLVTVPVAGKLTSSSTTFFAPQYVDKSEQGVGVLTSRSVDGLFHPNPPQYRYGFTPGGQYVDFFQMPTFCTTALTKFQREQTKVTISVDKDALAAQKRAEAALARGDKQAAQTALESIND